MAVAYVPASCEMLIGRQATLYSKVEPHEQETSDFIGSRRIWCSEYRKSEFIANGLEHTVLPEDDYTVCSPVLSPAFLKLNGIKMCLVNPFNKGKLAPNFRDAGLQVIADSGGFQIVQQKTSFIDPVKLAKAYNKVCTLGMDLDLPPIRGLPQNYIVANARIQNANHDRMNEYLNSKVSLVTILHGRSLDERKLYMDVIGKEDSKFISIGGLLRMYPSNIPLELLALESILLTVSRYKNTKYIHCLGCTSTMIIFIYALLDHLNIVRNIGGDSVSYVLNIASGQLFSMYPWDNVKVPRELHTTVLPSCSCPMCSTLHDYRLTGGYAGKAHSLYNKNAHKEYIVHLTKLLLDGVIKIPEFISLTNVTTPPDVIQRCIDYASEYKATGKFKELPRKKNGLFASRDIHKAVQIDPVRLAHTKEVIANYEKYYQKRFL